VLLQLRGVRRRGGERAGGLGGWRGGGRLGHRRLLRKQGICNYLSLDIGNRSSHRY
jgi:hypothetical protein